jgi:hypothetical protein
MQRFAGSGLLLGVLLSTPLSAVAPCDAGPATAGESAVQQSSTPAATSAHPSSSRDIGQASTGEPDATGRSQSSVPASTADNFCQALATAAGDNDLPVDFFTRLIWQESRFDSNAVSRTGAQGIAQFMPGTASWRGVANPFDPLEAVTKSAQLLRDLRQEFGNLGLAAAAYNAGPRRVREWIAGRRSLPGETRAYVRLVTGRSPKEWTAAQTGPAQVPRTEAAPCEQTVTLSVHPSSPAAHPGTKSTEPWGVELVGSSSERGALAAYHQLQQKYPLILSDREARIVFHGVAHDMGWARVRVGTESRASAEKLCASLRVAGAGCDVLRN